MLPCKFLSEIADRYDLSPDQKEVFLAKFGSDKENQDIASTLHIVPKTVDYRMGEIYKKFSISGKGTGKAYQLLRFLISEYQKVIASGSPTSNASVEDLDVLVQRVRSLRHNKIQDQCGTMRMLDISQPVALSDIYTDVNILEEISSQQRREIPDLLQNFNPESDDFDRQGLSNRLERVPGLDAVSRYSKLMVLGKPGAGKTTFLQWIANKCDLGEFQANQVPIFIRLKNFAEDTRRDNSEYRLLNYISEEFASCGITDKFVIQTTLAEGRALILLDGLDEVPEEDGDEVVAQIRALSETYFNNQFIITCRLAAQEYRSVRHGFTDVEIADFDSEQVEAFVNNWFVAVARNEREEGKATARQFIKKLNQPEYNRIRKLVVTPILLNLACLVFQAKGEFPLKHSKLYEQGLEILLVRWDESRGIQRDEVYRNLSLEHKIELLTQVAAVTFEKNRYFFEQDEIERYIAGYLRILPNTPTDKATLQRDSKAVLKSIEAQHGLLVERARGVYSFSHLTFQEYLTAKHFVLIPRQHVLKQLISGLRSGRWREVFLLAGEMLLHSDDLLPLKLEIDKLLASDEKLQTLLSWVNEKSLSVLVPYKTVAARAFYLGLTLPSSLSKSNFDFGLARRLDPNLNLDFKSRNDFDELALDFALASALRGNFSLILALTTDHRLEFEIIRKLHDLINQINELYQVQATFKERTTATTQACQNYQLLWASIPSLLLSI